MNALSIDLRKRIVSHYQSHPDATLKSTSERFGVGSATVTRLLKLYRETKSLVPKEPSVRPRYRVDTEWLKQKVTSVENFTLKSLVHAHEVETKIKVGSSSLWYALKSIGWSHKKNSFFQGKRVASGQIAQGRISDWSKKHERKSTHLSR